MATKTAKKADAKTPSGKQKTSARVIVNTCLLGIMTIAFGFMTWRWSSEIGEMNHLFQRDLALESEVCYENWDKKEGAFICEMASYASDKNEVLSDGTSVHKTNVEDYTLFLNDQIEASAVWNVLNLATVVFALGSMATLAGLIGTIVYWNHNRGQ